jgi:hypothetical protein
LEVIDVFVKGDQIYEIGTIWGPEHEWTKYEIYMPSVILINCNMNAEHLTNFKLTIQNVANNINP